MKRILVTGGLGFIGSHLVERLLEQGHEVTFIDNLSSNVVDWSFFASRWPQILPYQDDVQDIHYIRQTFDEVYHLAAPVGPAGILPHAGSLARRIIDDSDVISNYASAYRSKLVFVSTSEIYGGGVDGLCREDMPRIVQADTTVRLEYAVAKLAAETALINLCRTTKLDAVIVRPFNVAGPRQSAKGGFVLPRFVSQALRSDPLTVFGDGSQVRAFTHVADIVDGLLLAMERGVAGEAYNLGNPANKTTILDLARRVLQAYGSGNITYTDGKTVHGALFAEASDKFPDATKAMTELGWTPTRGIDETISDVFAYMRKQDSERV